MGPTCEILLEIDDGPTLDTIDAILADAAERIDRTRKGRVWDVVVNGRLVHVEVACDPSPNVGLSAGCNGPEDYAVLRQLTDKIASALGGVASEPTK